MKLELEAQYEKKLHEREEQLRQEALKQLEFFMRDFESKNSTNRFTHSSDRRVDNLLSSDRIGVDLNLLKRELRKEIEEELRANFEKEKEALMRQYSESQAQSYRNSASLEKQLREEITQQVHEEMRKQLQRKEKEMQVVFRQKLESHKKELDRIYENELNSQLDSARLEIEAEKNRIGKQCQK